MLWVLVLLAVVVAVLLVPVSVDLSIHREDRLVVSAAPRWGPFGPAISAEGSPRVARAAPSRSRRPPHATNARQLRALLFSPDFLPSLLRLARRLLRQLKPQRLQLRLKAGLGDPADTGRLWGALVPLALLLTSVGAESIWVEPDFSRRCFELDGHATVRVIPGVLLLVLLGYLFTPAPWRALTQYLRVR